MQSAVSAAVLPLWADPELAATSPEVAQRIVSIMTKCINGTSRVTVPSLARAGIRATYQPDASVVQQIVEMGFSAARAEEALRRVRCCPADRNATHLAVSPCDGSRPQQIQGHGACLSRGICLVLDLSPAMLCMLCMLCIRFDTPPALSWPSVLKLHLSCLMQVWPCAGSVHPRSADKTWALLLFCRKAVTALYWTLNGTCRSSTTAWNWPWSGSSTIPRRPGQVLLPLPLPQRRLLPTRSSCRASRASSTGRSRRHLLRLR